MSRISEILKLAGVLKIPPQMEEDLVNSIKYAYNYFVKKFGDNEFPKINIPEGLDIKHASDEGLVIKIPISFKDWYFEEPEDELFDKLFQVRGWEDGDDTHIWDEGAITLIFDLRDMSEDSYNADYNHRTKALIIRPSKNMFKPKKDENYRWIEGELVSIGLHEGTHFAQNIFDTIKKFDYPGKSGIGPKEKYEVLERDTILDPKELHPYIREAVEMFKNIREENLNIEVERLMKGFLYIWLPDKFHRLRLNPGVWEIFLKKFYEEVQKFEDGRKEKLATLISLLEKEAAYEEGMYRHAFYNPKTGNLIKEDKTHFDIVHENIDQFDNLSEEERQVVINDKDQIEIDKIWKKIQISHVLINRFGGSSTLGLPKKNDYWLHAAQSALMQLNFKGYIETIDFEDNSEWETHINSVEFYSANHWRDLRIASFLANDKTRTARLSNIILPAKEAQIDQWKSYIYYPPTRQLVAKQQVHHMIIFENFEELDFLSDDQKQALRDAGTERIEFAWSQGMYDAFETMQNTCVIMDKVGESLTLALPKKNKDWLIRAQDLLLADGIASGRFEAIQFADNSDGLSNKPVYKFLNASNWKELEYGFFANDLSSRASEIRKLSLHPQFIVEASIKKDLMKKYPELKRWISLLSQRLTAQNMRVNKYINWAVKQKIENEDLSPDFTFDQLMSFENKIGLLPSRDINKFNIISLSKHLNAIKSYELYDAPRLARDYFKLLKQKRAEYAHLGRDKADEQAYVDGRKFISSIEPKSLETLTRQAISKIIEERERNRGREERARKNSDIVFENDTFLVVHPGSIQASKYFGSGTKWCTAADNDNMFVDYSIDDTFLYYIINKKTQNKIAHTVCKWGEDWDEGVEEIFAKNDETLTKSEEEKIIGPEYDMLMGQMKLHFKSHKKTKFDKLLETSNIEDFKENINEIINKADKAEYIISILEKSQIEETKKIAKSMLDDIALDLANFGEEGEDEMGAFFLNDLDLLYPELTKVAMKNLILYFPYYYFHYKLDDRYPEDAKEVLEKIIIYKDDTYFYLKLNQRYPEYEEKAARNLLLGDLVDDFFHYELHKKYPEMTRKYAEKLAKNGEVAFFHFGFEEHYPDLEKILVQKWAKSGSHKYRDNGFIIKYPEFNETYAEALALNGDKIFILSAFNIKFPHLEEIYIEKLVEERSSFALSFRLLRKYPKLEKRFFEQYSSNTVREMFRKYPDVEKSYAAKWAREHDPKFGEFEFNVKYPDLLRRALRLDEIMKLAKKHSYKEKRKEDSGNITYIYDEKHIERRTKKKSNQVEKLRESIPRVRKQIKKDLSSDDEKIKYIALAAALIDETYERVGNKKSAEENKHYGVTRWLIKHVTFSDGKAKIKYVGKSGVNQEKEVKDSKIVSVLKEACKDKKKEERVFEFDGFMINRKKVNAYLKEFDITTKDIRGFHANDEMISQLKKKRSGSLPKDEKEKKDKLKKEFTEALEETAKIVGHEASTLKNQYLVPNLETTFMESGKIISSLNSLYKRYDIEKFAYEDSQTRVWLNCETGKVLDVGKHDHMEFLFMFPKVFNLTVEEEKIYNIYNKHNHAGGNPDAYFQARSKMEDSILNRWIRISYFPNTSIAIDMNNKADFICVKHFLTSKSFSLSTPVYFSLSHIECTFKDVLRAGSLNDLQENRDYFSKFYSINDRLIRLGNKLEEQGFEKYARKIDSLMGCPFGCDFIVEASVESKLIDKNPDLKSHIDLFCRQMKDKFQKKDEYKKYLPWFVKQLKQTNKEIEDASKIMMAILKFNENLSLLKIKDINQYSFDSLLKELNNVDRMSEQAQKLAKEYFSLLMAKRKMYKDKMSYEEGRKKAYDESREFLRDIKPKSLQTLVKKKIRSKIADREREVEVMKILLEKTLI